MHFQATKRLYRGVTRAITPFLDDSPFRNVERDPSELSASKDTVLEAKTSESLIELLNARSSSARLVVAAVDALLPYMANNPRDLLGALAQPAAEFRDLPNTNPPEGNFAELAQSFAVTSGNLLRRNRRGTLEAIDDINNVYAEDLTITRQGNAVTLYLAPSTLS